MTHSPILDQSDLISQRQRLANKLADRVVHHRRATSVRVAGLSRTEAEEACQAAIHRLVRFARVYIPHPAVPGERDQWVRWMLAQAEARASSGSGHRP